VLLLGVAIGFLAGRVTAPEERGRGGERAAASQTASALPSPSGEGGQSPAPTPDIDTPPSASAVTDKIVLPTRDVADEEPPRLEVDFAGFQGERTAWVALRAMQGGVEPQDWQADDDGVASGVLSPGTYEVWWFDADGSWLGTRARVEEGKVTRLRVIEHRGAGSVPKGVGLLRLEVEACSGGGLGGEVVWIGADDALMVETDAHGRAIVPLAPGRYSVEIGEHRSEAVIEEDRTTIHRIRHDREGDLVLVSERPGRIFIQRFDPGYGDSRWVGGGADAVVPYVLEGDFEITLEGLLLLGRARVVAGQTTRFRCELPLGGISVRLLKPGHAIFGRADVEVRRVADGRETRRDVHSNGEPEPTAFVLPPGRYVVTASAAEFEPASVAIEVSDRMIEATLVLERRR
jgi:hypothetical protein